MNKSKAFIVLDTDSANWIKAVFGKNNPWLLKLGKINILDYYIDFLNRAGFEEIRIVSSYIAKDIEAYLTNRKENISFFLIEKNASMYDIIEKNYKFLQNSDKLAIISGFYKFINKSLDIKAFFNKSDSFIIQKESFGFMFFRNNGSNFEKVIQNFDFREISDESEFNIEYIGSAKDYYRVCVELNRNLFKQFSNKRINFLFDDLVAISLFKGNYVIGTAKIKDSLIHPGSFVSKNAQILNSIIFENSYIPQDMKVENSIVIGKRIINIGDDSVKKISHSSSKSDFIKFSNSFVKLKIVKIWYKICEFVFFILLLLPNFIFKNSPLKKRLFFRDINVHTNSSIKKVRIYSNHKKSLICKIFFMFSLDLFDLLKLALAGEIDLIGENIKILKSGFSKIDFENEFYSPGILPNGFINRNNPNYHRLLKSQCSFFKALLIPFICYFERMKFFLKN